MASTDRSRPHRWLQLLGPAVAAIIVGVAIGRFTDDDPAPPADAAGSAASIETAGDALAALEARAAGAPESADAHRDLALAYLARGTQTSAPSFYELAGDALGTAQRLEPDDPDTLAVAGLLALGEHRFDDALAAGEAAVASAPRSIAALGILVDAHVELGHYDQAADALERMLAVRPSLPALSRASYLRQLDGDLGGAAEAMEAARRAGSGDPFDLAVVTALVGDLRAALGRDDAADAYRDADALAPGLPAAAVGMARLEAAAGNVDAAIERLAPIVDQQPSPGAVILLGELQQAAGDSAGAEESFTLARALIDLQADAGSVVDLELALFAADHGDPVAAVELAEAAHEARQTVYTADALAWAAHRAGDDERALALVAEATRLDTADPVLHLHAAAILARAGRLEEARPHLDAALAQGAWLEVTHAADVTEVRELLG